jgi:two-component system, NarL family, response regulator DegU
MSSMDKINVCIVDDHTLFRHGMKRLLETFKRVGTIWEAANGKELLDNIEEKGANVVLLDLNMPVMDGKQACSLLEQHFPDVRIIILSMENNAEWIDLMIQMGANGYLSKDVDGTELEDAIYSVFDKGFYYNQLVVESIRMAGRQTKGSNRDNLLSDRELNIVKFICEEYTMREISQFMGITEKTVQNHRTSIMQKLGVRNTAGLVKYAIYNQLIS